MAIDTRDKRANVLRVSGQPTVALYPNPDVGAEGQDARQHIAWTYGGILASGGAIVAAVVITAPNARDLIAITVLTPWPELAASGDPIVVNRRVVAVSYSTGPGGWTRASVGLLPPEGRYSGDYPFLPEPVELPEDAHVIIRYGGSTVYTGVVTRVAPNRRGFECEGYGLWAAQWNAVTIGGAERVTSGVMLREAIRVMSGWLAPGEIADPGIRHAWDEVVNRTPGVVIQQLCDESGHLFYVYEDNLAHVVAKTPKATPDVTLSYDPETVRVGWEYNRAEAVQIVYTDRDGRRTPSPIFYRPDVVPGKTPLKLEVLTGTASPDGAIAVALSRVREMEGIRLSGDAVLTDARFLNVRYGDTFELLGYGSGIVDGTTVDLFAPSVALALGQPSRMSPRGFLNDLARVADGARMNYDVVTGARTI